MGCHLPRHRADRSAVRLHRHRLRSASIARVLFAIFLVLFLGAVLFGAFRARRA
jgi:hypothetical protein